MAKSVYNPEFIKQQEDTLFKYESNFESLNASIEEDYKKYQEYSKQLDDLEIQIQEAPEEMQWYLAQKYNNIRDLHNELVDKLQTNTAQQKKIYEEYSALRESTEEPISLPVGPQSKPEDKPLIEGLPMSKPEDKPEPTWGDVVKKSLKSGLGQYQASLVNLLRLVDMGVTKLTDPIKNIIPISDEKTKKFEEKYGEKPDTGVTEILTKIVEDSEKIATESQEQAESKQWLKKLVGTGLQSTPQIVGSAILGAGMPVVEGLAAAKPTAEIITRVTQMIPFGLGAMGGQARQIEEEYKELGKEAPYYAMVIGGALSGVGEMATELPVFMGVARMLKGGGKALVNEGAKTLIDKYGKLGIEFAKNVALQSWQEAEMVPIEKGVKQAIGLPQDWSIKPLVKEMGTNAYGGMAMALVLGGLGGGVAGSTKIATKTIEAIDNVIKNKGDIKVAIRKVAELQNLISEMPEAETFAYKAEKKPIIPKELEGLAEEADKIIPINKLSETLKKSDIHLPTDPLRIGRELESYPTEPILLARQAELIFEQHLKGKKVDYPIKFAEQNLQGAINNLKENYGGKESYPEAQKAIERAELIQSKLKQLPETEKPTIKGIDFTKDPEVNRAVAKVDEIIENSKLNIDTPLNEIDVAIKGLVDSMQDKTLTEEQTKLIDDELEKITIIRKDIEGKPTEPLEIKEGKAKQLLEEEKPTIRGIDYEKNPEIYRVVTKADDIIEQSKLKIKYPLEEIDTAIKELKDVMLDKTLNTKDKKQVAKELVELKETQRQIKTKPAEFTEIEVGKAKPLPEGEKGVPSKALKNEYLKIIGKEIKFAKDRVELIKDIKQDIPISEELQIKYPDLRDKISEANFAPIEIGEGKQLKEGEKGIPKELTAEKVAEVEAEPTKTPTPPSPPTKQEIAGEPTDPIARLNELIKQAKPRRGKLETEYTKERARRIKEVERAIDEIGGERGYIVALSKLKGKLAPSGKYLFEPIKDKLSQEETDSLYNRTFKHPYLDEWEKISAANELTNLLSGELPTPKGLVLLEEIYGTNLIKNILSKRALGLKIADVLIDIANIPRAILATADMSGFLRQGIIPVVSHPVIAAKAMGKTFKFAFSQKAFEKYFKDLPKDKLYPLMRKSGLAITDPSRALATGREEAFISRLMQKIPIFGEVIKFAERAYVGFLNKLRVDVFKTFADEFLSKGYSPIKDKDLFKATAEVVNTFTGRGSLGNLNRVTPFLNTMFFSPRLIMARFNALNPIWYTKMPKEIRIKAICDFSKFVAAGITLLTIIGASGLGDVETDPRSSDFGKIRIGNTRWDIWGGFQQWCRVFAQLITGQRKNTSTGEIVSLSKDEYPFTTRKEVLLRFIEGKLAPVPALVNELISGAKTFEGEDITFETVAREKFIPMYIQDITEAYMDGGLGRAVGAGTTAFFGVGVQTWQEKKKTGIGIIDTKDLYKKLRIGTSDVYKKELNTSSLYKKIGL